MFWEYLRSIFCKSSKDKLRKCEDELEKKEKRLEKLKNQLRRYDQIIDGLTEKNKNLHKTIEELNKKLDRWVRGTVDVETEEKDSAWIRNQVSNKYPDAMVKPLDRTGLFVSKGDAKKIVKEDLTQTLSYVRDTWDCENYAYLFASLVKKKYGVDVGIVLDIDAHHAYNLFIYSSGEIELFEPQSDEFSPSGEHYSPNTRTTIEFF